RIQGTPGQDLNIVFGRSARTSAMVAGDEALATAGRSPDAAAVSSEAIATRLWSDWLRLVVAFTIVGWLLLLVAGGLREHGWLLAVPLGVALVVLVGLAPYVGGVLSVLVTVYGIGSLLFRPTLTAAAGPEKALVTRQVEAPSAPGRPIVD